METLNSEVVASYRCADAFNRMYWAFPFFLDFRIGINNVSIDVLPDLVGWLLIATALSSIPDLAPKVAMLRNFAYVLAILALPDLVNSEQMVMLTEGTTLEFSFSIFAWLDTANFLLNLIFMWMLCGLIMEMASLLENEPLREQADFRRKLYIALGVLPVVVPPMLLLVLPILSVAFVVIGVVATLVALFLLMDLMRSTKDLCNWAATDAV